MSFISELDQPILRVSTFSALPPANSYSGQIFEIADLGVGGGALFYSDGVYWRPVNGSCVIGRGSGTVTAPLATLPGTELGTYFPFTTPELITIPRGMIFPGSSLEVRARMNSLSTIVGGSAYLDVYLTDGITPVSLFSTTRAIGSGAQNQYNCLYRTGFPAVNTAIGGFFRDWFFSRTQVDTYSNLFSMPFSTQDVQLIFALGVSLTNASSVYGLTSYSVTFKG